jgi:hypothetical protein
MRCETCDGKGRVWVWKNVQEMEPRMQPCPDCGGCRIAHCCDGLTAANETPEPEPTAE